MTTVRVTFLYDPDDPDDDHPTGMSEEDHGYLSEAVAGLGGYDIEIRKSDVPERQFKRE
jgi:hypothetical protein